MHRGRSSSATPVTAVLEVERRAGTPREGVGTPPPLAQIDAESGEAAFAALEAQVSDDRVIVQLLHDRGLR